MIREEIQFMHGISDAQQKDSLEAYYFFSTDCPQCASVSPRVKELSRELPMRGFVYGTGDADPMPFEVGRADKVALKRFDVHKFPTLVLTKNGLVKQIFIGEQDISDAGVVLSAFQKGAWSVSEVM
jgi:thiol-disulfide isomerase/thioredoxin